MPYFKVTSYIVHICLEIFCILFSICLSYYETLFKSLQFLEYVINHTTMVIKNGKIVWKHRPYYWYFRFNLKYLGWPCEALLWKWWQRFWGSSEDRYRLKRVSEMLLVCYIIFWIAKIFLSINNTEKSLVTRTPQT